MINNAILTCGYLWSGLLRL